MGSPIAGSHGPGMIGVFVNVFLYGIVFCQIWSYYSTYQNDSAWIKYYVGLLMLADSLNTLFACWWIFDMTIMHFGDLPALANSDWVLGCDPAMGGIIAFYCQSFFAWRLKVLTGNKWLAGVVFVFGFCVMLGGIGIAIALGIQPELSEIEDFRPIVYVWLIPGVCADLIITISMTYYLRRRRTGFSKTAEILDRIVRLTIQSCLLTTLCALGDLTSYLSTSQGYHIGFSFALPKLYSNSVMSSLNSRPRANNIKGWEDQTQGPGGISFSGDDVHSGAGFGTSQRSRARGGVGFHLPRITGGANDVINLQDQHRRNHTEVYVDVEMETQIAGDRKPSFDDDSAIHSGK